MLEEATRLFDAADRTCQHPRMTRAERLLALVRLLRTYRYPVAGQQLAEALSISLRTLYRDIATLQAQGADIRGEPGLGYVLHPGFVLPPLMFTEHELEALMLGMRWVTQRADPALSQAANDVLAKAEAVLPPGGAERLNRTALFAPGVRSDTRLAFDPQTLRDAIRRERKVRLSYPGEGAHVSERVVRPLGIGYFDQADILAAWCESRQAFRHFRLDRIQGLTLLDEGFEGQGGWLLRQWRTAGLAVVP
ncbi:helix-turn-helix transcriptional regulator [Pseudomonas alabamensis]|uniref:helix-turn-helix transcriptional regulator n=1 Tax=Pseudomonas alabamensis TaxID=3064349 RepID=UPI003F64BDB1